MGFGLGLSLSQKCTLSYRLRHSQKLGLELLQKQELLHPEYPNMLKGISGLEKANSILKENFASGILIGGLSQKIWNLRRTKEELETHKDVDVLILNKDLKFEDIFHQGIDWWYPRKEKILFKNEFSVQEKFQNWYENDGGVVLNFALAENYYIPQIPGLYIPKPSFISQMKLLEKVANIDLNALGEVEIDEDVEYKFLTEIRKKMGKRLPPFMSTDKYGKILPQAPIFERFSLETLRAIHYYNNNN